MQKVISINLNGNAYQLEEAGYDALRAYLAGAERALEGNPDRAEIMADLEQAIADKCGRFLAAHKSVVTAAEVDQIVREMGPIDAAESASAQGAPHAAGASVGGASAGAEPRPASAKRLFRIPEGAMFAGVCTGLSAYTGMDVTVVRLIFAALTVFGGAGLIIYPVLMFVVPEAQTPEEYAAAGGAPFNAQDVVDRAKQQYAEGSRRLRTQWRRQRRHWRAHAPWRGGAAIYGRPAIGVALMPVFGMMQLVLFLVMAGTLISLVNTGAFMGRELPHDVPMWAAVLTLLIAYQILVSPLRVASQWSQTRPGWYAFWNAAIGLAGMAFVVWFASTHKPEIQDFLQRVPEIFRDFAYAIRDLFARD
jgi:phage shock protein PspC (stress-responsive transcriptional regulator)